MAAGTGINIQISNTYDRDYGSAAVLNSFTGWLTPVSTDKISGGFQKAEEFVRGTGSQPELVAGVFGKGDETDYYHTKMYLRTNGGPTDVYLSGIGYTDSDSSAPISTAIRVGLVVHEPGESTPAAGEYKYQKKTVMAGELLHPQHLKEHLADLLEWKNLTLQKVYGAKGYTLDELLAWVDKYCEAVKPYITNTTAFLRDAQKAGKSILFEAQLGALRDLDYGIYPYTTSSNAVAAYAPVGSGLPTAKLDDVVGVVKAYSSCVGEGPFVCEWFGEDAQKLRDAGAEYGAKTGRPRRVGPIDLVATRYGVEIQGATTIALTKLDILSYMDKIPVCAHYELDGQQTDEFPFPVCLQDAKPVIEYVDGWKCDISKVRSWDELPENARNYVEYVERAIGCHIGYVSVGAERDSLIIR